MKGIPFKPEMVKAIVKDRKTVTRRLHGLKEINTAPEGWQVEQHGTDYKGIMVWVFDVPDTTTCHLLIKSRFRVGETVFVQEAWATENRYNHLKPSDVPHTAEIFYVNDNYNPFTMGKTRSPMFMPEWTARYFLKIKDVRPERLWDITPEDCYKEGCLRVYKDEAIQWYQVLWDSINPKYPFSSNPWVFRQEFERVEKPNEPADV